MLGFGPLGSAPIGALPDDFSATFNLDGQEAGRWIIQIASLVDRELIKRLHQFPDDLRFMDRRKYEEVVAEIFSAFGYEVELTQRTRDGGKDIIAIKHAVTPVKFLIECKRPDPGNPIRIGAVRELYGVKCDDQATKAILATTTYFTPDAEKFSNKHLWELELRDFEGLKDWIAEYVKIRATSPQPRPTFPSCRRRPAPTTSGRTLALFGPGERTAKFRLGTDQLLADDQGNSSISYEDFAVALVDEIENPAHTRQRFTVGY